MDEMKGLPKRMFYRYCIVFTLVITANILLNFISKGRAALFETKDLMIIEIMSILCGLGDLFFIHSENDTKKQGIIRAVSHYIYINVVVIGTVLLYTSIDPINLLLTLVSVAVIYCINTILSFCKDKKDAIKMNDILQKINNNDE